MKVIRISSMVLRLSALLALILGILFWTGIINNGDETSPITLVHIVIGFILVISLWTLGIAQGLRGGSFGLAFATFIVGLALAIVGMFQTRWLPEPNPNHWIIQVIHLLLALIAIGLGEMIAGRARRSATKATA